MSEPAPDPRFERLPGPSVEDKEMHPGDFVVLTESDPYYVGNHPAIVHAYANGVHGRVLQRLWVSLRAVPHIEKALGKSSAYEVTVKFPHWHQPFVFWMDFLKKVPRTVND